ncbi:MAG: uracil-DNA glycosylase [Rhodospirillales bacterium]|nr:uracil-DNA glycosylase [Rhodospirillales bacterium]
MATRLLTPPRGCSLCPRLAEFREKNRAAFPAWHNAPVEAFGPGDGRLDRAKLLIVGLAPGLKGANRTGRPFTGDFAGDLLYPSLIKFGLAEGAYGRQAADGLTLTDCRLTNAVRCVPPLNRPTPAEMKTCRKFLASEIAALPALRAVLALGAIAHESVLAVFAQRKSAWPFKHAAVHRLPGAPVLVDSYHCSRQNTNTGRLTEAMFHAVIAEVQRIVR